MAKHTGVLKDVLIISNGLKLNHFTNSMEQNPTDPGETSELLLF